jgi:hypothetical protein
MQKGGAKMRKISLLGLLMFQFHASANGTTGCSGTPHTMNTIAVDKAATCVLSKLYETQSFCLVDASGNEITSQPLQANPGQVTTFGMIFNSDADFNMEYALTCVENNGGSAKSPKVIFTIGASGPAEPDISIVNMYGATGAWQSNDSGESYSISFDND